MPRSASSTHLAILICLLVGCASRPAPQFGLYCDEEIRGMVNYDIDHPPVGKGILGLPYLDVVPAGKTSPRKKVFEALGIDESRLAPPTYFGEHHVAFLIWKVSPSYDLVCMTGIEGDWDDPDVRGRLLQPDRFVYGIRLAKHKRWP